MKFTMVPCVIFFLLMLEFMYAKWQVFLHTGSCLNGEKGILLSPMTKVFKKNCFILECGVSYSQL